MRIGKVSGENFLGLGEVEFDLDEKGLILLQGVNHDDTSANSNGSGKSSLMDLVSWTLWGTTARGVSGDDVIRVGTKTAIGVVMLHDDTDIYRVTRTRSKGNETQNIWRLIPGAPGGLEDLSKGTLALNRKMIERILGCSYEMFSAAVYIGQEAMPDLPGMTDKQLKELIEEASGLKLLEDAYDVAKKRVAAAVNELNISVGVLDKAEDKKRYLLDMKEREENYVKNFEERTQTEIKQFQALVISVEDEIKQHKETLGSLPESKKIKDELDRLNVLVNNFAKNLADVKDIEQDYENINRKLAVSASELKREAIGVKNLKAELVNIEDQIGKPCSECGTPMTTDHVEHARTAIQGRISAGIDALARSKHVWEALKAQVEEARQRKEDARANLGDHSALLAERDEWLREWNTYERTKASFDRAEKELVKLKASLNDKMAEQNPHKEEVMKLNKEIGEINTHIADCNMSISANKNKLECETAVMNTFSPKGVRAYILDEITPFLNERTAFYLNTLSDGNITAIWSTLQINAKGELKEKFAISVAKKSGASKFGAISGGEKRKARLACALALQDLVASRSTKPINIWVADEIDAALDRNGMERLMMVLQDKAKERGTVVVISHGDLRDWFDTTWQLDMLDGKATLTV